MPETKLTTAPASQTAATIDIESIVRRVLQQLSGGASAPLQVSSESTSESIFELDRRLIALDDLKLVSKSTKCLRVPSGVVITPAAKDELKRRGIRVDSDLGLPTSSVSETTSKQPPGTRAIRLQHDGSVDPNLISAVKKQATTRGVRLCDQASTQVILSDCPATTAHQHVGPDRCVVMINRIDDVSRFMAETNPNVFVLDILHLHLVALTNALATIARPATPLTSTLPKITIAGGRR